MCSTIKVNEEEAMRGREDRSKSRGKEKKKKEGAKSGKEQRKS